MLLDGTVRCRGEALGVRPERERYVVALGDRLLYEASVADVKDPWS